MKVTVKEFLNVRVGKPSVNAPTFQFLAPGTVLDVEQKFFEGDPVEGNKQWVKDEAGNYYWSGGIHNEQLATFAPPAVAGKVKFNYNELINISDQFKATKGKDVVVAIIDTGCHNHPALGDSVIGSFDVFTGTTSQRDRSIQGHGTFLAGMIGARESSSNEIVGVAPLVKLIIVKAVADKQTFGSDALKGLQWLSRFNVTPDIINMSFDFVLQENLKEDFNRVFNNFIERKTILVAAGQDGPQIYSGQVFYPASHTQVKGVGCIAARDAKPGHPKDELDYVVSDFEFLSTTNLINKYRTLKGSSMSTAFVSGALALIRSWQKSNPGSADAVEILNNELKSLSPEIIDSTLKLFKK